MGGATLSERKTAEEKVKPDLMKMGFSEDLISDYDSVLVRFGTNTGRVDFVCYYRKGDEKLPFLVVEVKTAKEDIDPIQAESYAQRLDAPFFAVTNGKEWHWYLTGKGQSNSIRLRNRPLPLFYEKPLTRKGGIEHKKDVLELVRLYEDKLKKDATKCPVKYTSCAFTERPYEECEECLVWNVVWINWALKKLSQLYGNFEDMSVSKLANILGNPGILWGIYPPNIKMIRKWVQQNPEKTKETIAYLVNENIPIETRFDSVVSGRHHINGIGSFLASMLFAGLNREKYTIISNRNLEGLKRLGLIDIQPTYFAGIDYVNFNRTMLELSEFFRDDLGFGRSALVHDFTLLVGRYLDTGRWRG